MTVHYIALKDDKISISQNYSTFTREILFGKHVRMYKLLSRAKSVVVYPTRSTLEKTEEPQIFNDINKIYRYLRLNCYWEARYYIITGDFKL